MSCARCYRGVCVEAPNEQFKATVCPEPAIQHRDVLMQRPWLAIRLAAAFAVSLEQAPQRLTQNGARVRRRRSVPAGE